MKKAIFLAFAWLLLFAAPAMAAPVADWVETGRVEFKGADGFVRSQGVASDGGSLWFSWNLGLMRTEIDDPTRVVVENPAEAIPPDLIETNHNHIGDIDVADGILYAPIEDGPAYAEPWIVLYDAATLEPTGKRYLLPATLQRDGVPWIAVDAPRGVAYSMEWNDTGKLFVYDLDDFELLRTVELQRPLPRIQGAKVFRGYLYASRDNGTEKSVEAIDPTTGEVTHLFDRNLGENYEAEGIAFVRRPTGTMMVATGIRQGVGGYTEMRTYRIGGDVTPPNLTGLAFSPKKNRPGRRLELRSTSSEAATVSLRWLRCAGPKRRPCSRVKRLGVPRTIETPAGESRTILAPNYARSGKAPVRLSPGTWRLEATPTDRADIVGAKRTATVIVLKPRRQAPRRGGR